MGMRLKLRNNGDIIFQCFRPNCRVIVKGNCKKLVGIVQKNATGKLMVGMIGKSQGGTKLIITSFYDVALIESGSRSLGYDW